MTEEPKNQVVAFRVNGGSSPLAVAMENDTELTDFMRETPLSRAQLYNLSENEVKCSDYLKEHKNGVVKNVVGFAFRPSQNKKKYPQGVIYSAEGFAVRFSSKVALGCMLRICGIYGNPNEWEAPLDLKITPLEVRATTGEEQEGYKLTIME